MDWQDLQGYSPLEDSLYGFFPSPLQDAAEHHHHHGCASPPSMVEWNLEENKLFEEALAKFNISSPDFFENVASRVPSKSVEDVKRHYQALVDDIELIESGQFPVPDYGNDYDDDHAKQEEAMMEESNRDQCRTGGSSAPPCHDQTKPQSNGRQRRRGIPWTEEEHQLFLMGLNKYGKGDWRSISRYYVITKTPTQVASHAQKYFYRQISPTPADRRRPSIHDIQTVNPIPTAAVNNGCASAPRGHANNSTGSMAANLALAPSGNPNLSAYAGQIPTLNPIFLGGGAIDQNPVLLSNASAFASASGPSAAAFMNHQPSAAYHLAASFLFPSMGNNQPWG